MSKIQGTRESKQVAVAISWLALRDPGPDKHLVPFREEGKDCQVADVVEEADQTDFQLVAGKDCQALGLVAAEAVVGEVHRDSHREVHMDSHREVHRDSRQDAHKDFHQHRNWVDLEVHHR